jgi:hypothetical protein
MASTKLHFKGIDWVLYFPTSGNENRPYPRYGVAYRDRPSRRTQPGTRIDLDEVLKLPAIADHYPHRVGVYQESSGRGRTWAPVCLEERDIVSSEELFMWLKDMQL